jgi:hypothetical protein
MLHTGPSESGTIPASPRLSPRSLARRVCLHAPKSNHAASQTRLPTRPPPSASAASGSDRAAQHSSFPTAGSAAAVAPWRGASPAHRAAGSRCARGSDKTFGRSRPEPLLATAPPSHIPGARDGNPATPRPHRLDAPRARRAPRGPSLPPWLRPLREVVGKVEQVQGAAHQRVPRDRNARNGQLAVPSDSSRVTRFRRRASARDR